MRKPSEYIAAAARGIRDRLMDDCRMLLERGGSAAPVTRAASVSRGDDELAGDGPAEALRVLAVSRDLPSLSKGDDVRLDGTFRLVTSLRTDPSGASSYVGLSAPFNRHPATVSGARRTSSAVRPLRFPLDILAVRNGTVTDVSDGYAPSVVQSWTLCVSASDWPDADGPQIGDEFIFDFDGESVRVKVTRQNRRDGFFNLDARSR